jgi:hypothetical protein
MRSSHGKLAALGATLGLLMACGEEFSSTPDAGAAGGTGGTGTTTTSQAGSAGSVPTGGSAGSLPTGGNAGSGGTGTGGGAAAPKRVFVSSEAFGGGEHPGLVGLDALCGSLAASASLGGAWVAWASTYGGGPPASAINRVTGDGPWNLVNGEPAFANRAQLAAGPTTAINRTENDALLSAEPFDVWTGSLAVGTPPGSGEDCNSWTTTSSGAIGLSGLDDSITTSWSQAGPLNCDQQAHVYCFEL